MTQRLLCQGCGRPVEVRLEVATGVNGTERNVLCTCPPETPVVSSGEAPVVSCDFCLSPQMTWERLCKGFTIDLSDLAGRPYSERRWDEQWGACDACRRLIDADDMGGLLARGLYIPKLLGYDVDDWRVIARMHAAAVAHLSGDWQPFTP